MPTNTKQTLNQLLTSCGIDRTLHVESGNGELISALLNYGVDAYGLDASENAVTFCNQRMPGRFSQGSILALPFNDNLFQTIVVTNCFEHLIVDDILIALGELYRVTTSSIFISLATNTSISDNQSPSDRREWWETKCFEAGFRKHPAYYKINSYESLNRDGSQICILLEKIPRASLLSYSLASLNEERGLHMDMSRDTGERSDAHIIRYQWACNYIKPGDRVLDAACGLGYGGNVIRHLTNADKVVGIDGSEYAIDYAKKTFLSETGRAEYLTGMLPESLSSFADGSFDVIISFETLEHVEYPQKLLNEFHRLLTPGGRIVVSVPNDWSDETGEDPNPFHLHVYDWPKLESQLSAHFTIEDTYAQTASQCKVVGKKGVWERKPRALKQVALSASTSESCEWWLMTAMKSPFQGGLPYEERAFRNISNTGHPSIRYSDFFDNPWLMHAMVNSAYRQKNTEALVSLANDAIVNSAPQSNDYAAALCVKSYHILNNDTINSAEVGAILASIHKVTSAPDTDVMHLRWKVSLLSIKAKLLQKLGQLQNAKDAFVACTEIDAQRFGVHLATKISESYYLAGKIAYALKEKQEAHRIWRAGIEYGKILLNASLNDILINPDFPNRFNHGDGIREYTIAWDNIARCANGVHLLNIGEFLDFSALDNCLQTEYSNITTDIIATRKTLLKRTELLEKANEDLLQCTNELIATRQVVVDRTELLEKTNEDLLQRTNELIATRQVVVDRTELLEKTNEILLMRTEEVAQTRQELAECIKSLKNSIENGQQLHENFAHLSLFNRIFIKRK
ncbi:MAG: methyltransferase domain-containing protein [Burkholderiales bacterium]|nr:methyltransferase domain-containing protein [Burkholderiales bacterium]